MYSCIYIFLHTCTYKYTFTCSFSWYTGRTRHRRRLWRMHRWVETFVSQQQNGNQPRVQGSDEKITQDIIAVAHTHMHLRNHAERVTWEIRGSALRDATACASVFVIVCVHLAFSILTGCTKPRGEEKAALSTSNCVWKKKYQFMPTMSDLQLTEPPFTSLWDGWFSALHITTFGHCEFRCKTQPCLDRYKLKVIGCIVLHHLFYRAEWFLLSPSVDFSPRWTELSYLWL